MKQQTAVQYLVEQLKERGYAGEFPPHLLFQHALEMERQQIIDAHKDNAVIYEMDATAQAEHYYTQTFTEPKND
jgi:hypothetical protein